MKRIQPLLLLALCMTPFVLGLHGPFMLDDESNLKLARASTGTWGEIFYTIFHNDSGLLRRPIANLSFLINYHLIGHDSFDYKLVNLFLHWLNTCLIWRLAVRVLGFLYPQRKTDMREACGLFIAMLWALHPIQISTVLYAVQRMTELSAFFVLLALLAYLRLLEKPTGATLYSALLRGAAVWSVVMLGLMSKENAALFPCFVLAIYISAESGVRQFITRENCNRSLFAICCWIPMILGTVAFVLAFSSLTAAYASRDFTLTDRILTEPFIVLRYLGTILIPNIRHMGLYLDDMPIQHIDQPLTWLVLILVLIMPVVAIYLRRRAPALSFAIIWFLAAHLLESTVLPLELAFEHRNYVALFGPMFAAGYYFFTFLSASRFGILKFGLIVPVVILAAGTVVRAHQWSTADLFIQMEAANHPFSPRAQNEVINFDIAAGNIDKVVAGVKKVQALKPDAFWPLSLDFNLACGIPNYPVQWDEMKSQIRKRPGDVAIPGMLLFDTDGMINTPCHHLDPIRFDAFLASVADIYQSNNMPYLVEKMLILRSHIAAFEKKPDQALALFATAAKVNPRGLQALHELAYYALNTDNLDVAANAIDQLEARVHAYAPASQYDVDELRGYLAQARNEKATAEIKSQGHY